MTLNEDDFFLKINFQYNLHYHANITRTAHMELYKQFTLYTFNYIHFERIESMDKLTNVYG